MILLYQPNKCPTFFHYNLGCLGPLAFESAKHFHLRGLFPIDELAEEKPSEVLVVRKLSNVGEQRTEEGHAVVRQHGNVVAVSFGLEKTN